MASLLEKATRFSALHTKPGIIVLPNAWDPGSAIVLVEAGFRVLATTRTLTR
ncbi:MAG: isocitrate lyase/phosphoenolpyruvate mutase family protein [Chloroflexi bacterium]|nr:isocitrate lyase/phosphoenolpyruvate mutase family protein [Chloroflexota bacterium]